MGTAFADCGLWASGANGGRHLPRLRIVVCVLFLGRGRGAVVRGRYLFGSCFAKGSLPGQKHIDGEAVVLASSG